MPTYTTADSEAVEVLDAVLTKYHPHLANAEVTINALFANATIDEKTGKPKGDAIKHHSYPALAIIKINSVKDRVEGKSDATVTIDADHWPDMEDGKRIALLDHELTHLELVKDETGAVKQDDAGRPRLKLRPHDWQGGYFWDVVERHGEASCESESYKEAHKKMTQLLLPWG